MSNISDKQFSEILKFCAENKVSDGRTIFEYIANCKTDEDVILPVKFRVMLLNTFENFNERIKDEVIAKIRRYYENYDDEEFDSVPKQKTYLFTVRERDCKRKQDSEKDTLYDIYQIGRDVVVDNSDCRSLAKHMISIAFYPRLTRMYEYWKSGKYTVCPCTYTETVNEYGIKDVDCMFLFKCPYCSNSKNDKNIHYKDYVIENYSLPVCHYYVGYLSFEIYKLDLLKKDILEEMEIAKKI